MNKDNAHKYLPLVQALANGKTLQYSSNNGWTDISEFEYSVFDLPTDFRIKPEPRTFDIARRKSDGLIKNHAGNFINNEWERITVQEVIE